jgi:ABC-type lipoprotein release transport system permease subunit
MLKSIGGLGMILVGVVVGYVTYLNLQPYLRVSWRTGKYTIVPEAFPLFCILVGVVAVALLVGGAWILLKSGMWHKE